MRRRNEVTVGVLVTVALVVLVMGAIWLARGGFGSGYPLYTRFGWGQNLKDGQAVRLAGVSVGYVDGVALGPGYLDVKLAITEDKFRIPRGTVATVRPVGIFGDVEVALTPPNPLPTEAYAAGDTIPAGASPPDISAIMGRVDTIGRAVERLAAALDKEFVAAGGIRDLRRASAQLVSFGTQLQSVMAQQNANLTSAGDAFRGAATKLGDMTKMVDSAKVDSTVKNFRTASDNLLKVIATFDSTARTFKSIVDSVEKGQGSVGRLLKDPTLALRMEGIAAQLDSLLLDIKNNPKKYMPAIKFCC
jgi:phospholipid/cholesterol/gamma-HCH transport system substrate-binding protein